MVTEVKGDGQLIVFLVNKKHNHLPESVQKIDYNKVIIFNNSEHKAWEFSKNFSAISKLQIGAEYDLNVPPAPITVNNAWETGNYYLGVLYHNSTHNVHIYKYIELNVNI